MLAATDRSTRLTCCGTAATASFSAACVSCSERKQLQQEVCCRCWHVLRLCFAVCDIGMHGSLMLVNLLGQCAMRQIMQSLMVTQLTSRTSMPLSSTLPDDTSYSRMMSRSSVDLPQPAVDTRSVPQCTVYNDL
jgi:hypothetical protein